MGTRTYYKQLPRLLKEGTYLVTQHFVHVYLTNSSRSPLSVNHYLPMCVLHLSFSSLYPLGTTSPVLATNSYYLFFLSVFPLLIPFTQYLGLIFSYNTLFLGA